MNISGACISKTLKKTAPDPDIQIFKSNIFTNDPVLSQFPQNSDNRIDCIIFSGYQFDGAGDKR